MLCQIPDSKQNKNTLNSAKKSEGQGREKLLVLMQCLSLLYNNFLPFKNSKKRIHVLLFRLGLPTKGDRHELYTAVCPSRAPRISRAMYK